MTTVYFTASTRNRKLFYQKYKKIISLIKKNRTALLSGEQIINEKILAKDSHLSKEQIFQRQKKFIDISDFVIAEVTEPAAGVGGEIVYALTQNKPVLALVQEGYEDKISPMVAGNPSDNLFLEHYTNIKVPYIIKNFTRHISMLNKRKGILIVIDGGDGSGKTVQAKKLVEYLKQKKVPVKYMDFPQYYNSFHGKTVAKLLRGEFGNIEQVSPYLASLSYALDRASVKQEMEDFLKKGGTIISNRYATSNMAHQGAKFNNQKEREDFLTWVYDLEYKIHRIPKETIVLYLYVPWKIGLTLTKNKGKRSYLKGQEKDIHEKDMNHLRDAETMYLSLAKKYKHWDKIVCVEQDKLLSPEKIHQKIIESLRKNNILKDL